MIFSQNNAIVNAVAPVDGNATAIASDIVSLKGYNHATFILTIGIANTSSATSANLIAYKGENVTTCATAFAAKYRYALGVADVMSDLATLAATGVSLGSGNTIDYNIGPATFVVEIDAEDLAPTAANPYDTVKIGATFSAHSVLLGCVCILSEPRIAAAIMPTAITD